MRDFFNKLRISVACLGLVVLSACAKDVYAPDIDVQRLSYQHSSQPSLTLITMINNKSGSGAHSALIINGSQRIMYDPAGRWTSSAVAERADVLFGVTPSVLAKYKSFHSRQSHHVLLQEVPVSPQVAEIAIRAALQQGSSHDAMCAINTSQLLQKVPGFQSVKVTWFPKALSQEFAKLPGVRKEIYAETDIGKN